MIVSSNHSSLTIGVCSDTHYWFGGPNHQGKSLQLQENSELLFECLLAELRSAELDVAVHLGDMVSGGGTFQMSTAQFRGSLERATTGLAGLPMDVYALPGNHDCVVGDAWSDFGSLWSIGRGEGKTIDTEQVRLVLLNAQGHSDEQIANAMPADPVNGWVTNDELVRLEEALATAGDKPVLLFSHQLLVPWSSQREWLPFYGVGNAQSVLDILRRFGNVRAVFQGHAHQYDVQTLNLGSEMNPSCDGAEEGCTFFVLPSLIEYPLGWLKLTIYEESLNVELQQLPLEELSEMSRVSGMGQEWRIGRPEWKNVPVDLRQKGTVTIPIVGSTH